jgi:hypothetical protein
VNDSIESGGIAGRMARLANVVGILAIDFLRSTNFYRQPPAVLISKAENVIRKAGVRYNLWNSTQKAVIEFNKVLNTLR